MALGLISFQYYIHQKELDNPFENTGNKWKCDVFEVQAYDWNEKNEQPYNFKFIIIEKYLSFDNDLPFIQRIIMDLYYVIKKYSLSEARAFGLESSLLKVEKFPMIFNTSADCKNLKRIH